MTEERFREIVEDAHKKGETSLLIWKNEEEREKSGGNEKKMLVDNAFEMYGKNQEGVAYGNLKTMELTMAIQNYFKAGGGQLKLGTKDGEAIAAMAFKIENLLSMEGHFMFAYRGLFCKHLNGPIVLIPSCQVVE